MAENPYAPPGRGGEAAPPPDQGISFNDFDLERVSRATTWMKRVSSLQLLFGSVLLVLAAVTAARGWAALSVSFYFLAVVAGMGLYGLLLLMGAVWLRQSCIAFYDGIMANAESGLAIGFRKLRLYLIMYGMFGLVGLVSSLIAFVGRGGI